MTVDEARIVLNMSQPLNRKRLACRVILVASACVALLPALAQNLPQTDTSGTATSPSAAEVAPTTAATDKPQSHGQLGLQIDLPQLEFVWLETADGSVQALYRPDISGKPQGALVYLPAEGQHPAWPDRARALLEQLPKHGWAVLSVALPALPRLNPARPADSTLNTSEPPAGVDTTSGGQADDQISADSAARSRPSPVTIEQAQDQAMQIVSAATAFANSRSQFNLVLAGDGLGAVRALSYLAQTESSVGSAPPGGYRGVILIDLPRALPLIGFEAEAALTLSNIPTLDLYADAGRAQWAAQARADAAVSNGYKIYEQRRLGPAAALSVGQDKHLVKAVRGFLKRHAQGMEVGNKAQP